MLKIKISVWAVIFSLLGLWVLAPASAQAVTVFTASGDYGSDSNASAVIDNIGENNPDFHLALGDLSYGDNTDPNQEANWCDYVNGRLTSQGINSASFPFQLVSGNHEDDLQPNGFIGDFVTCMPDRMSSTGEYGAHYYFDVDNIRFIMISPALAINGTTYTYTIGSDEYQDVSDWIDDARAGSADWIIVGIHKTCMNVGSKGTCEIGGNIMDLLIDKNVDLILHGHEHNYQRTRQLTHGTGCTVLAFDTSDSDCMVAPVANNTYNKGEGPVDIIAGTGGKALRDIKSSDPERGYYLKASGKDENPTYGNLVVTIDGMELHGKFSSGKGAYSDDFVITSSNDFLVDDYDKETNLIGDFNGDGKDDVAYVHQSGDTAPWRVGLSSGQKFNYAGQWIADFGNNGDKFFVGDFNGDRKDDIAYARVVDSSTVSWKIALSTGRAFRSSGSWASDLGSQLSKFFVGDFNGDRKDDIAYARVVDSSTVSWRVGLSTGKSFRSGVPWATDLGSETSEFFVGDFNGDRKDDIAYSKANSASMVEWRVGKSKGNGFTPTGVWSFNVGDAADTFKIGDVNGDGKDDIIYIQRPSFYQAIVKRSSSNGSNFKSPITVTSDFGNDGDRFRVGDFNNNGRDDLAQVQTEGMYTLSWKIGYLYPSFINKGIWNGNLGDSTDPF